MIIVIIIFFISIIGAFGMLMFRAWEIRTSRIRIDDKGEYFKPELSFRYFEKIVLFLMKHLIQWVVLSSIKVWYTSATKTKIWLKNKLPKINRFIKRKTAPADSRKISFVQRAVIESKIKIKRVKEKIKKEHEKVEKAIDEEVDKIL